LREERNQKVTSDRMFIAPERVAAGVQIEEIMEKIALGDRERIAEEVHDTI